MSDTEQIYKRKTINFQPTLSFDGVAIISGIVILIAIFVSMRDQTNQNTKDIEAQKEIIQKLQDNSNKLEESIAVLTAVQSALNQKPTTTVIK